MVIYTIIGWLLLFVVHLADKDFWDECVYDGGVLFTVAFALILLLAWPIVVFMIIMEGVRRNV